MSLETHIISIPTYINFILLQRQAFLKVPTLDRLIYVSCNNYASWHLRSYAFSTTTWTSRCIHYGTCRCLRPVTSQLWAVQRLRWRARTATPKSGSTYEQLHGRSRKSAATQHGTSDNSHWWADEPRVAKLGTTHHIHWRAREPCVAQPGTSDHIHWKTGQCWTAQAWASDL